MISSSVFFRTLDARQRAYILGAVAAGVMVAGVFAQDPIAYLCVAISALVPLFLWLRSGAHGMPVLPMISGLFYVYYALPILRNVINVYGTDELVRAAMTVGGFLIVMALAAWPFMGQPRRSVRALSQNFVSDAEMVRLVFAGLGTGILFHLAVLSDSLSWLGAWSSVLRSFALTFASIACAFLRRASGSLAATDGRWRAPDWSFSSSSR